MNVPSIGVLGHALLGLLAGEAGTGYDLTRRFDKGLGHVWTARHSQIYPELAKLQAAGLIAAAEAGPRGSKRYAITDAGRAELQRWMREPPGAEALRSERLLRTFFLPALPVAEQRAYLASFEAREREQLAEYEALAAMLDGIGETTGRISLEAGLRVSRTLADWAAWAQERVGG